MKKTKKEKEKDGPRKQHQQMVQENRAPIRSTENRNVLIINNDSFIGKNKSFKFNFKVI